MSKTEAIAAKRARGNSRKAKNGDGQFVVRKGTRGTTWALRFVAPNGERVMERLGRDYGPDAIDRKEAEARADQLRARVKLSQYETPGERNARLEAEAAAHTKVPVFEDFAREWLERRKAVGGSRGEGLSEAGASDLEWRLSHLNGWFGGFHLDQIDEQEIDRFMAAKRAAKVGEGGLGPVSTNKVVACLRGVLKDAVRYRLIDRNPATDARVAAPKYAAAYLDRASQIIALLDAAGELDTARRGRRGHGRALLATLTYAGLRIGEALDLRWGDVDLARGTVTVRAAKTAAGIRTVDVLAPLRDELLELKTRRPTDREALVFVTTQGGKENASNVRTRTLEKAVTAANKALVNAGEEPISVRLTPHGLRHTFASLLVALGEDPSYVMGQLGHTDAAFTLGVYAKSMKRRDGERDRLEALVKGQVLTLADVLAAASDGAFPHHEAR